MDIDRTIRQMARDARQAAGVMGCSATDQKNQALTNMADLLEQQAETIVQENRKDLKRAGEAGLSRAMVDRLTVTGKTIAAMAGGLREVAAYPDPVGTMGETRVRPNGLRVSKMRIPLGVIGIIYESRPNVTIDAAGLCLKSGNAVILRGGSEALYSNRALAGIIGQALESVGLPAQAAQVVPTDDRAAINALLAQDEFVDLIIPRGGEGLIRFVVENSRIPVLKHYKGVCHVFVDHDGRPSNGRRYLLQCQGSAARRVQRHGDAAGPRTGGPGFSAGHGPTIRNGRRSASGMPENLRHSSRHHPRHRRGLVRRVSGFDPGG